MAIQSVNPATGEVLKTYHEMSRTAVQDAVSRAHDAFLNWRSTTFSRRTSLMRRAAQILRADANRFARLIAHEMGKPIQQGRAEIEKCAVTCDYYSENAERFLAPENVNAEADRNFVAFDPLGVVLAIMPWNFPFWQVFRFAAPSLMAGNAAVLKHASNVPGCAQAIEETFDRAGFPKHLFTSLLIGTGMVGSVIRHPLVRAVTLTGSGSAGQAVAGKAGEMLKKTVLELGGSDPYLVLEDADLEVAAELCAKSRLVNSGQSCVAAKRFIVIDRIRAEFEQLFVEKMSSARMGDPLSDETDVGPLARSDLRDGLHRQVEASLAMGARLLLGGVIPSGPGAYYPPTVLTDVRKGMPASQEEMFGPVAAIMPAANEAEAVHLANDSIFGLGAGVMTRDLARGERIASLVESGSVFVNGMVHSDPRLPFGGVKSSGYGRELSVFGIREFVNIKTICVYDGSPGRQN